ncbi:MAG: hypothetical protein MJD61_05585 [Proteobacteria bacterium]|nr:hypothetical protein [Pseudomonadota bacterium]
MQWSHGTRWLVRLALGLLVVAGLAGVAEWLALQAPGSPWCLGILPGPVASLRNTAAILSLALLGAAWLWPWANQGRGAKLLLLATYAGAVLTIGSMVYAAAHNMYAIQLLDPRADAGRLVAAKIVGHALLGLCLLDFARRIWVYSPPTGSARE